jgi:predicted secreted hydrolase
VSGLPSPAARGRRTGGARALAIAAAALALGAAIVVPGRGAAGFRYALPGYAFRFPRDHASHPDFQNEWWYYTGHLAAGARRFGYELTFFRVGIDAARTPSPSAWTRHTVLFAHLALTDEDRRVFRYEQRVSRPALGLAGADTARYRVWIEDWSAGLDPDGRTHRLAAAAESFGIALALVPEKPPVVHGENGVSRKASGVGRASHYVSLTRLATGGTLRIGGDTLAVTGVSWMDHEFGSNQLGPGQSGWDWFSIQLDDRGELMLYRLRHANGSIEPASSGTWIEPDGRAIHLPLAAFSIASHSTWTSAASGGTYPARWTVRVPGRDLVLDLEPTVADQELRFGGPAGVTYWEGSVRVTGRERGRPVTGVGYVELTGYAGRPIGF